MQFSQKLSINVLWVGLVATFLSAATISLDSKDEFNVSWTLDDQNEPKFITFQLKAKRQGWIALGFSPNGGMAGSDIIKASIDGEGNVQLLDMYASGESEPDMDKISPSDVELLAGSRTDDIFSVTFRRPLRNCDAQDWDITGDTTRLIFAWGTSHTFSYHGGTSRGSKSVYLLEQAKPVVPDDEPGVLFHDFKYQAGYMVPEAEHTIYTYGIVIMPPVTEKHHIISFEVTLTPGNEGYIHHMIVYACYHDYNVTKHLEERIIYTKSSMPQDFDECTNNAMLTWAVGGGVYHFPEHTGVAIGDELAPKAWLLGIHYDNPTKTAGTIRDFSGIRIRYTNRLRQNDMGHFNFGSTLGIYVPPGQNEFYTRGDCSSSCIQLLDREVNVFGYFLHGHLLSHSIYAYRHRDGNSDLIGQDRFYDNNFQESRHHKEEITLRPGDELSVVCKMKSTDRSDLTYGGLATTDEMCIVFMYYYPRIPNAPVTCQSKGLWMANPDWMETLSQKEWSGENLRQYETRAMTWPYTQLCLARTGSEKLNKEKVYNAYPVSVDCPNQCKPSSCRQRSWYTPNSSCTRIVFSFSLICFLVLF